MKHISALLVAGALFGCAPPGYVYGAGDLVPHEKYTGLQKWNAFVSAHGPDVCSTPDTMPNLLKDIHVGIISYSDVRTVFVDKGNLGPYLRFVCHASFRLTDGRVELGLVSTGRGEYPHTTYASDAEIAADDARSRLQMQAAQSQVAEQERLASDTDYQARMQAAIRACIDRTSLYDSAEYGGQLYDVCSRLVNSGQGFH